METAYRIISIEGIAAHFIVTTTLCLLVLYDLFKGRKVVGREICLPLGLAALCFLSARACTLASVGPTLGARLFPEAAWILLNLSSFLFAAVAMANFLKQDATRPQSQSAFEAVPRGKDELSSMLQQTGYCFAAGGVAYFVLIQVSATKLTLAGPMKAALFTAVAGPAAFIFRKLIRSGIERKQGFIAAMGLIAISWFAMFAAIAMPTRAENLRLVSMLADVLALFVSLMLLRSHNLQIGLHYREEADFNRKEMERAKNELARLSIIASDIYEDNNVLIKRQKEQAFSLTKRVENLEKMLEIGMIIQKRKDLRDLLQMIVELVRENLGFNTVILRLLNSKTRSFETRAYVGLNEEVRDTVLSYRMPLSEYEKMIEAKYRISNSYFLRNSSQGRDRERGDGQSVLVDNAWGDIDLLIVPLIGEDNGTIGYLSVENPENATASVADVIENLEIVSALAVTAIRNANLLSELEGKNEKLKSYATKLSSLNKMKANFVATISHEFRTPLTSIKAYCETLLRNAEEVDRKILKEFLVVIDEESDRLVAHIEDILDFSQMESGAIKFERTPCNLNEIIVVAAKELEKNFNQKHITLHQELPGSEVTVRAERELMKQLLINLLHNASKFTPDGGNVWVRLEDETVSARIVVEDDGVGIPEEQVDKVFERFHQADGSSTRKHGGSGLGLAMCKNIVDWHDGRIWVENLADRGTRFVTVLPKKQVIVRSQVNLGETVHRFEVERYLELIVEMVAELIGVRRVSLMLLNKAENELRVESAIGLDEEVVEHAKLKPGEGIAGRTLQAGSSLLVDNIEEDERIRRKNNDFLYDSKAFLSVPIKHDNKVIGVVNVSNHISKDTFDDGDCRLLELFTERISIALGKLDQFVESSIDFGDARNTLKAILDMKRYVEVQNAQGIMELVVSVSRKLGLSEDEQSALRYVLSIYDLGLSRVGYHIIKKPFELSPEDRRSVEQHTQHGADMLKTIEVASKIRDIVLYHHENFDGTGYPSRLSEEAIPLEARIVRVADSLRALISHRPYQRKYSVDEAKDVLEHRSGTFFDPKVVNAFLEVLEECSHLFGGSDRMIGDEKDRERV